MAEIGFKTFAVKSGFSRICQLGKQCNLFEPIGFVITALLFKITAFQNISALFIAPVKQIDHWRGYANFLGFYAVYKLVIQNRQKFSKLTGVVCVVHCQLPRQII